MCERRYGSVCQPQCSLRFAVLLNLYLHVHPFRGRWESTLEIDVSQPDWQSKIPYEHLQQHDAPGFAWQFLRRNPEFTADTKALSATGRNLPTNAQKEAFARKWGVRCHTPWRISKRAIGAL